MEKDVRGDPEMIDFDIKDHFFRSGFDGWAANPDNKVYDIAKDKGLNWTSVSCI